MSRVPARKRSNARAAALPASRAVPELIRLAPSVRSILVGLLLFALAVGAYVVARDTSVFSVQTVEIRGATPAIRAEVRSAVASDLGKSLLRIDGGDLERRLAVLADVHSFRYDRAFPHTLRLVVRAERPVLVVRRGGDAFLVAASGRILRPLAHPRRSSLPRLWLKKDVALRPGDALPGSTIAAPVVLASLQGAELPGGVKDVRVGRNELTLDLNGGLEVRLGDAGDLRLKLAIARRILRMTGAAAGGPGYLDVSVPERPVLSSNSQVGG
jgi:cell division septal protein FtsQ